MTETCGRCGQSWDRDPALEVACPSCGAEVGAGCKRPSGHECAVHADRDRKALEEVEGYEVCPVPRRARPTTTEGQRELFD